MTSSSNPAGNSALLKFYRNTILKGTILFLVINFAFTAIDPSKTLSHLSFYNIIFPGRKRLPYGEIPGKDYNLNIYSFEAMFESHEITAGKKPKDEYRVILIGDSATWGYLLPANQTLANYMTSLNIETKDNRYVKCYNLGYPVMSLLKDLVILQYALNYDPDLIIWSVTLESFPLSKQIYPPILQHNPSQVKKILNQYQITIPEKDQVFYTPSIWDKTLIGQRRNLADLARLQFFGFLWAATGIDHNIPTDYALRMDDLTGDQTYYDFEPPTLALNDLALDTLKAGMQNNFEIPIMLVNEPIFLSQGENSNFRYNFYYPRWAYDSYRQILSDLCHSEDWNCLDLWDAISPLEFTNTAIHMTPSGTAQTAKMITETISDILNPKQ